MHLVNRRNVILGASTYGLGLSAGLGAAQTTDEGNAKWLRGATPRPDTTATPSGAWLLRREFTVRGPVKVATLCHAGLGAYETYLNARRIGNDVLAGDSERSEMLAFQQHDVTSALVVGGNAIGGFVGNGAYGMSGVYGLFRRPPLYWAQLDIGYADGSTDRVVTGEGWQVSASPVTFNHIHKGETWDARRQQPGWAKAAFTPPPEAQWYPAETVESLDSPRVRVDHGQYRRVGMVTPLAVTERPSAQGLTFERSVLGWAKLTVSAAKGARIELNFRDGDGKVVATDTYVVRDDQKVEVYEPHFTIHTFQTVQAECVNTTPTRLEIQVIGVEP